MTKTYLEDIDLNEISGVDIPAQLDAVVSIRKRINENLAGEKSTPSDTEVSKGGESKSEVTDMTDPKIAELEKANSELTSTNAELTAEIEKLKEAAKPAEEVYKTRTGVEIKKSANPELFDVIKAQDKELHVADVAKRAAEKFGELKTDVINKSALVEALDFVKSSEGYGDAVAEAIEKLISKGEKLEKVAKSFTGSTETGEESETADGGEEASEMSLADINKRAAVLVEKHGYTHASARIKAQKDPEAGKEVSE